MWKGSGINFANIEFSRMYHPPIKGTSHSNVLAEYNYDEDSIRFFLPGFKKYFGKKETAEIVEEAGRVMSHECLHGVIMYCLWKDKYSGEVLLEWPLNHGLDPVDTKELKEEKKKK